MTGFERERRGIASFVERAFDEAVNDGGLTVCLTFGTIEGRQSVVDQRCTELQVGRAGCFAKAVAALVELEKRRPEAIIADALRHAGSKLGVSFAALRLCQGVLAGSIDIGSAIVVNGFKAELAKLERRGILSYQRKRSEGYGSALNVANVLIQQYYHCLRKYYSEEVLYCKGLKPYHFRQECALSQAKKHCELLQKHLDKAQNEGNQGHEVKLDRISSGKRAAVSMVHPVPKAARVCD
ncbi:Hypothetical Protein FCC1311_048342 [Hondaea fermentalgiana]|uniref:Uncharacterized protein n=1 Tax=Hondaea fermentalgiana TaxID=2315210 RepID=A0A2R5GIY3_9STRA|nr:Hypothetical Protein FCC1311_048342 [Hondaea fermentalgiana]|eukprot:GBG28613.1 Hypothetical Protein FCC1311_048342 [Hondaea fermentalgiana]